MKIKSIKFIKYRLFKDYEIVFGDESDVPEVSFLVGNNGSGKTQILDALYHLMDNASMVDGDFEVDFCFHITEDEKKEVEPIVEKSDFVLKIKREKGESFFEHFDSSGNKIEFKKFHGILKIIYSTAVVEFGIKIIKSTTGLTLDSRVYPKDISRDLSIQIPQLIIDIGERDEEEKIEYLKNNKGSSYGKIPPEIGSRLNRFTNIFNTFFDGAKIFSEVKKKYPDNSRVIIFKDFLGNDISLNQLSTGEKQIVYRIAHILKNLNNLNGAIILIDEPELSLHPAWQRKFKEILCNVFNGLDVQIIIATHSPYIFEKLNSNKDQCIKIDRTTKKSQKINLLSNVHNMPSVSLITYLAFGISTEILHIELYTLLQIEKKKEKLSKFEEWLKDSSGGNVKVFKIFTRTIRMDDNHDVGEVVKETLPTFIRNKIHHGDERGRVYTPEELEESINIMIELLS